MKQRHQSFQQRQEMKCDTFEIFNYNDEARQYDIPIHHHDFYEVYFYLKGNIHFMIEDKTYSLAPGDIILICPGEFHKKIVSPEASDERIVLWIDRRFLSGLHEPGENLCRCFESGIKLIRTTPMERSFIQNIAAELVSEYYGHEYCSNLASTGLFIRLMVEINRVCLSRSIQKIDSLTSHALVSNVLSYIGNHYAENITLDSLATEFFVSKYHLSHEFSDVVGTSVYKYIILKRLASARQLILDGMSPGTACHECGYSDYSNFYRAFRSLYGTNPDGIK